MVRVSLNLCAIECQFLVPFLRLHISLLSFAACTHCNTSASTGDCDHISGHCVCQPNVIGYYCDECGENTYNYTSEGCTPCDCNVNGSVSQNCNVVSIFFLF